MYSTEINLLKSGLVDRKVRSCLKRLFQFFKMDNKELFLVGGVVRDLMLNKKPKDYDLCTNATPEEAKELVERYGYNTYDSGIKHGTITILDERHNLSFELTTYRCDGLYSDSRHPDSVEYVNSLEEDLKRRDFTINSFTYNLLDNKVYMLDKSFLDDLNIGIIRTVGNSDDRFNEDALRMLRAFRFSAQLGFSISEDVFNSISSKLIYKLSDISKERIRDELTKIIMSDNPQVLEQLLAVNVDLPLPELTFLRLMAECEHENPYHYTDVFHHTMDVIKSTPKKFELRWAALLHDSGKPLVKELKEGTTNHYHYHNHPEKSVEIANSVMTTLRFSNDQIDLISKYIKYHDSELVECRNSKFKKVVNDIGEENFLDYIKLRRADALAHKLTKDAKFATTRISKLYDRYIKLVVEKPPMTLKDLCIDGHDVMSLGYKGKDIGKILEYLLDCVLEEPELNTRDKLFSIIKSQF